MSNIKKKGKLVFLIKEFFKKLIFRYTNFGAPKYEYCIEPIQLTTLINLFEELKNTNGCLVEVGVARGQTTKFLAQHIQLSKYCKINKNFKYYALDTFSSFTKEHLDWEIKNRGKKISELIGFEYNDYSVWKRNFKSYKFIEAIECDCSTFNFNSIAPVKLAFLDVDLYLPTKKALINIYPSLVYGGYILIDDIKDNSNYDGAYQACMEFIEENKLDLIPIGNKSGLIKKVK